MTLKQNKAIWGAFSILCVGGMTVVYMLSLFVLLCLQENAVVPRMGMRFWAACGDVFDGMCWAAAAAGMFALAIAAGYLFVGRVRRAVESISLSVGACVVTLGMALAAYIPFFPVALVIDSARRAAGGQ